MLETQDLTKNIEGRTLFRDVNLSCPEGSLNVLFGPSGSGKSTFIRTLAGFVSPDRGTVTLDGTSIEDVPPRKWRRQVVLLHQQPKMFAGDVERNLTLASRYHELETKPEEFLERCQLDVDLQQPAETLSGGEQKRLALARALSVSPRYLLLDEPTASLDEQARMGIDDLIQNLSENIGIIFVTHNPEEVRRFGIHGFHLVDGELKELGEQHLKAGDPT